MPKIVLTHYYYYYSNNWYLVTSAMHGPVHFGGINPCMACLLLRNYGWVFVVRLVVVVPVFSSFQNFTNEKKTVNLRNKLNNHLIQQQIALHVPPPLSRRLCEWTTKKLSLYFTLIYAAHRWPKGVNECGNYNIMLLAA